MIHYRSIGSWHALCGRKVVAGNSKDDIGASTDVLDHVTCPTCRMGTVHLVKAYNKARRAGQCKGWDK